MPAGLYGRVASRGFPSNVAAGQTGVASLESQGGPTNPIHGQALTADPPTLTTKPGFQAEAPDLLPIPVLPSAFGLPGGMLPDDTPRTHAGPIPGWAGSYDSPDLLTVRENSNDVVHGDDFGALDRHITVHGVLGRDPSPDQWDIFTAHDPGTSVQDPVTGQLRAAGGRDQVQGYGRLNGNGFDAGHRERHVTRAPLPRAYLDPGERVWIIPQASGNFVPSDTVQGPAPWIGGWAAESVNATPPTAYAPPPDPTTNAGGPVGAPPSAGWW